MELTKKDCQIAKGIAIIGMVMLHLFCRRDELPYIPLLWIGKVPLVYYLGLLGDMCVPIFCFCSGYAHYLLREKNDGKKYILEKIIRFLLNYWIVVSLFAIMGITLGKGMIIPQSVQTFLGNILLYDISYNGAWWFVVTYVIFLLTSPGIIYITKRIPSCVLLLFSSLLYIVAYIFRFKVNVEIPNIVLNWIWEQFVLFGTSQFCYVLGMICRKNGWFGRLRTKYCDNVFGKSKVIVQRLLMCFLLIGVLIGHCVIQSVFVAPFTAAVCLVNLYMNKIPLWLERILLFFGEHSTNIWLVHMFYYLTLFENLVFKARYPIFIVGIMLVLCIVTSYAINIMYVPISNKISKFIKQMYDNSCGNSV